MRESLKKFFCLLKTNPVKGALLILPIALLAVWLVVPKEARAIDFEGAVVGVLGWIFSIFIYILGNLLVKFIDLLVWVAQYNDFVNAEAVKVGWTVVRDVANMFFIVGLLVISFGTVFRIQEYRYNNLLSRLIIMAVLINFSKTIAAFFIDVSQVIMLTFVNAFKDMAAGNLTSGFGVAEIVSFSQSTSAAGGDISVLSVAGAMFAAVIMLFVATVVVAIFTLYLIQRIVMLWIYIILAPMAFMLHIFPGNLGSFWGTWWRDFTQYVVRGPVIAFFLWLTLTIISLSQATTTGSILGAKPGESVVGQLGTSATTLDLSATASQATTSANILNYLMAIGLLVAGLMQTAKAGGAAGSVAGKWMGNFQKWGGAMALSPIRGGKAAMGGIGSLAKLPAYNMANKALGAAAGIPLVGVAFGKMQGRLNKQRLKAEEKDSDWVNYADEKTVKKLATNKIALTEGGRRDQKIARERLIKNNEFKGYSAAEKQQVLKQYRDDIGYRLNSKTDPASGKAEYYETAVDASGKKILRDFVTKKNPAGMVDDLNNARKNGDLDLEKHWIEQMQKSVNKMTTADINDMDDSDWDIPEFRDIAIPELINRASRPEFKRKMRSDVNAQVLGKINNAYRAYSGSGIDLFRRGVKVKPGGTEEEQEEQRRLDRADSRTKQIHEITGLKAFVDGRGGKRFGVDNEILKAVNYTDNKGGFIRNPQTVKAVAGLMSKALSADISSIESELKDLDDEELNLREPGNIFDLSGNQMTKAQAHPEQLQEIQERRQALLGEQKIKQAAIEKFNDPEILRDFVLINRDQHATLTDAKQTLVHEGVHQSIQAMDPDGSFRNKLLREYFTPPERAKMRQDMANKANKPSMSFDEAFNEYLAEGLTNQGGRGETGEGAVTLKEGLPLLLKQQAEAKNVKFQYVGMGKVTEPAAEIQAPGKVGVVASGWEALKRKATQPKREEEETKQKAEIAKSAEATIASHEKLDQLNQEYGTAEKQVKYEEDNLKRLKTVSGGKVDKLMTNYNFLDQQRQATKNPKLAADYARQMNVVNTQIQGEKSKVTEQQKRVEASRQDFAEKQRQLSGQNTLTKKFEAEQAAKEAGYAAVIPGRKTETQQERLEAEKALTSISQKVDQKKAVAEKTFAELEVLHQGKQMSPEVEHWLDEAEASLKGKHKKTMEKQLGKAEQFLSAIPIEQLYTVGGKLDPVMQQKVKSAMQAQAEYEQAKQEKIQQTGKVQNLKNREEKLSSSQKAFATPPTSAPGSKTRPISQPAPARPSEEGGEEAPASSAEQVINITNNIRQEIKGAMRGAPQSFRDTLYLSPASLDNAMRSSLVMRSLMNNLRTGFNEVAQTKKLSGLAQTEISKRINNLQKHVDNNDGDSFKDEFSSLQRAIGSSGGSEGE